MSELQSGETLTPAIEIRPVRTEDAEAVSRLYRETWLATYPNAEAGISHEDVEAFTSRWVTPEGIKETADKFVHINDDTFNAVAVVDGKIAGNSRAYRYDDSRTYHGKPFNKLQTIYVLPEFQGKGVGPKLFEAALDFLGSEKPIILEVATYNQHAIDFYKRYGFDIAEKGPPRPEDCGMPSGAVIPEYIMLRPAK